MTIRKKEECAKFNSEGLFIQDLSLLTHCIEQVQRVAPELTPEAVIQLFKMDPPDTANGLVLLTQHYILHFVGSQYLAKSQMPDISFDATARYMSWAHRFLKLSLQMGRACLQEKKSPQSNPLALPNLPLPMGMCFQREGALLQGPETCFTENHDRVSFGKGIADQAPPRPYRTAEQLENQYVQRILLQAKATLKETRA